MQERRIWLAAILFSGAALAFPADHYKVAGVTGPFYFGHISLTEMGPDGSGPTIRRAGSDALEPATLNTPVGPGDVIRTTDARRCEIQFDSGTIVRLDVDSELEIETILAGSLSSDTNLSNLVLRAGRAYVMFKEYNDRETFQVLTDDAAVKLKHHSVAVIAVSADGGTEVRVRAGKASVLFGEEAARSRMKTLRKGERGIVTADGRFGIENSPPATPFEAWNEKMNADFIPLHKGVSPLPKPVQTLPKAVFDFAQRFGNRHGEWLWDDLFGYVWRPYLNDLRFPWGNWSPYVFGRWTEAADSLFWVPGEPWGWAPYHLGLWQWDRKRGWFWIPGSVFAPAWAAWEFFANGFYWRPWTLFDWFFNESMFNSVFAYGYYGDGGGWPRYPYPVPDLPAPRTPPLTQLRKDQLKKPEAAGVSVPKDMRRAYGKVVAGLGRKDAGIIESLKGNVGALLPFRQNAAATQRLRPVTQVMSPPRSFVGPSPVGAARFRDWNPDIRIARNLGVRIGYSSRTNEVLCPDLKLSSRDLGRRGLRMSSGGLVSRFYGGGFDGSAGNGGTSSDRSVSSSAHPRQDSSSKGQADSGKSKRN